MGPAGNDKALTGRERADTPESLRASLAKFCNRRFR